MNMVGERRPLKFDDLMEIERISNPAVHPDGRSAAYVMSKHDHRENKVYSTIMLIDLDTGKTRELTPGTAKDSSPVWSPDGRMLAFASNRDESSQLWILPFEEGGEAYSVTKGEGGVSNPIWAPDSRRIAFSRSIVVSRHWDGVASGIEGKDKELIKLARTYGLVNERSTARVETSLLYRHWDHWRDMKRSHLFIVDIETRDMEDITPGDADVPPISLGGARDFSFSPGGNEIAYVMNPDPEVAVSTNNSVFLQELDGIKRTGEPLSISQNDAMELEPRYSPDGNFIAYLGAEKPAYEADRLRIRLYERSTGDTSVLTEDLDRSPSEIIWKDNRSILFLAPDMGYISLYELDIIDGSMIQHTSHVFNSNLRRIDDGKVLVTRESMTGPAELYILELGKGQEVDLSLEGRQEKMDVNEANRLTEQSEPLDRMVELNPPEEFWYKGADEDPVHGFLLKPPGFIEGKRYPLLLIIHGGPQSAFFDHFHFRWNPQMFASGGYVVAEINPRGSIGYGQKFTDQISGDWGGRCYEDIMKGLDFILDEYPFIDSDHIGAAGASFGGFMINWIAGHSDRFNVLISHDGIFNQETMSYMTEELWFDIWEHGGMPHDDHEVFLKYSPHMHVQNFKTPMLVIQGELDFRCPVSEGVSLFTALQVMKVPSKFLYFPDEGHWILKPANSHVWYTEILDFIKEHI